jgi:hypothetical protein
VKLSAGMAKELQAAALHPLGRLSPCAYQRHRNALKSRGLVDDHYNTITEAGRSALDSFLEKQQAILSGKQNGESTAPTVPDTSRLVILEEAGGKRWHVGWFSHESNWWFVLSREKLNGDPIPGTNWCSLSMGSVTEWREIHVPKSKSSQPK